MKITLMRTVVIFGFVISFIFGYAFCFLSGLSKFGNELVSEYGATALQEQIDAMLSIRSGDNDKALLYLEEVAFVNLEMIASNDSKKVEELLSHGPAISLKKYCYFYRHDSKYSLLRRDQISSVLHLCRKLGWAE